MGAEKIEDVGKSPCAHHGCIPGGGKMTNQTLFHSFAHLRAPFSEAALATAHYEELAVALMADAGFLFLTAEMIAPSRLKAAAM